MESNMRNNLKMKVALDNFDEAIELVLDLAFQNIADPRDNPSEYRRQMTAFKLIEETFSKNGEWR